MRRGGGGGEYGAATSRLWDPLSRAALPRSGCTVGVARGRRRSAGDFVSFAIRCDLSSEPQIRWGLPPHPGDPCLFPASPPSHSAPVSCRLSKALGHGRFVSTAGQQGVGCLKGSGEIIPPCSGTVTRKVAFYSAGGLRAGTAGDRSHSLALQLCWGLSPPGETLRWLGLCWGSWGCSW